eukprot:8262789-Prorocentrum_lima.AAC.1
MATRGFGQSREHVAIERVEAAKRLWSCSPCCWDAGLAQRLRRSCDTWESLLQEPMITFLRLFFLRSVVTS